MWEIVQKRKNAEMLLVDQAVIFRGDENIPNAKFFGKLSKGHGMWMSVLSNDSRWSNPTNYSQIFQFVFGKSFDWLWSSVARNKNAHVDHSMSNRIYATVLRCECMCRGVMNAVEMRTLHTSTDGDLLRASIRLHATSETK